MSQLSKSKCGFKEIGGPSRQQGAILVVALVVLLVMTLLGVGSRVNTLLQQKMSVAYQQKGIAGVAAETAMRAASDYLSETIINTPTLSNFQDGTLGLYSSYSFLGEINVPVPSSDSLVDVTDPADWTNANSVAVAGFDSSLANPPRYIIEYIGRQRAEGGNKKVIDYNDPNASADTSPHMFRITAIGWGRDEGIYSVLQSTYATGSGREYFVY